MIEYLPLVLTGLGLTASILYYTMTLRNANKTQQMQLETRQLDIFMKWQQIQTNLEWRKSYTEVASMEWDDFDDFARKYSHTENPDNAAKRFAVWSFFDGLGYMLSREVIDCETMYDMTGNSSIAFWTMYEPIIEGFRERDGRPETWRWFEYLATEMKKVRKQRGLPDYELPWKPD